MGCEGRGEGCVEGERERKREFRCSTAYIKHYRKAGHERRASLSTEKF